jgi:hypothetical protein
LVVLQRKTLLLVVPLPYHLWLTVLKENGFMVTGSFKPTPKKGSDDYNRVRKIFDERKSIMLTWLLKQQNPS